ncbi:MAG: hypothetical protein JKX84_01565 [Flavobacteriales bacterium]|nr:hypothetical protein [Flavobacteriales bacterium]
MERQPSKKEHWFWCRGVWKYARCQWNTYLTDGTDKNGFFCAQNWLRQVGKSESRNFVLNNKNAAMDVQADINWIKSELDKVKDPSFIQVLKSLLDYRSKQQEVGSKLELSTEEQAYIERGLKQAGRGETVSSESVHKQVDQLLGRE